MTKDEVQKFKDEMEYSENQFKNAQSILEVSKRNMEKAKVDYRIAEVEYVIENLLYLTRMNEASERLLDTYLVHCLNTLHGNIDGTIVSIDKEVEEIQERRRKEREGER